MSKVITKYAINCLCAVVCFASLAWLQENPFLTRNILHVTELSPVLSDPLLNYERMWVSPFSKLKGNICLINVILICLYWTLNNNLPSSHSRVCLPECTCFLHSDFLNIYLWDLSNFSIDWCDGTQQALRWTVHSNFLWEGHNLLAKIQFIKKVILNTL